MSIAILGEVPVKTGQQLQLPTELGDYEAPAGSADTGVPPRDLGASFAYRGLGEPHWRGQLCYLVPDSDTHSDERLVSMVCGCQACVPWWTLESRAADRMRATDD